MTLPFSCCHVYREPSRYGTDGRLAKNRRTSPPRRIRARRAEAAKKAGRKTLEDDMRTAAGSKSFKRAQLDTLRAVCSV